MSILARPPPSPFFWTTLGVCMALLYVRSKVCIAPFYVWSTSMGAMQNLLRKWSRAMQTLLRTANGDMVSGNKK